MENENLVETSAETTPATAETPAKPKRERKPRAPKKKVGETMTLHGCRVGKKTYRSVWAAFQGEFGINSADCKRRGRHIKFRYLLKREKSKKLVYTTVGGKKVQFTLVDSATAE